MAILKPYGDSLMENGINPRENGAKKWTDPYDVVCSLDAAVAKALFKHLC